MNILHLSDIHFRKSEVETTQDPNFHLRSELLRDIAALRKNLGDVEVLILSGDIAFAGDAAEYGYATTWLEQLCKICGAPMSSIFVIPGNHDVDRKIADSEMVQNIHNDIKSVATEDVNDRISAYLLDPDRARLLYESLGNYNAFAQQFLCDLLPPNRTRACRDVKLNDGSTLRLWGLNTAFVSSSSDDEGKLFIDTASLQITREYGVTNLVATHHYLSWIRQKQALEDHLNDVAAIQLFGHIHTNRVLPTRDWMRFTASATHPDRRERGYEPGYNWIEVTVEGQSDQRQLLVRGHVQVWQSAPGGFHPKMDGAKDTFENSIALEPWKPPQDEQSPAEVVIPRTDRESRAHTPAPETMTTLREIGVKFYRLTFSQKFEIAGRLGLLEDSDGSQPDFERFRRVLLRASEQGKLAELADAVEKYEGEKH